MGDQAFALAAMELCSWVSAGTSCSFTARTAAM